MAVDKEKSTLLQPYINTYYADNARKLHKVVDKILFKFGGISDKDRDDFYSLANEVFVKAIRKYDPIQSFDGFLYSCLSNKIMSEMTRRNRGQRKADRLSISLDSVNQEEEECSLLDFIASDFDTFEEAAKTQGNGIFQDKVQRYMEKLSNQQVNILNLLIDGYKPNEVRGLLEMSQREYADNMQTMRSYENIKILF